ncbi:CaiB/BaiF CoA transferase family protein [Amphiplicatus metriothermophilus]|uniref:Formyl-CoA transferase n=1 Tax=Amphiplicatus metriothermophilus TaxID=1519374 RepID=A0A239PSW3_9PROT|nr:CaiB/BaiF CoA-transferase family protein [Amphiplicatus metriothermophilus]MBB5519158.1 formyl-CoA transferase [Amphiplicatus metriothermophilus]SNT73228.1 formyl-CoA transferase [Amphiplicatus metriothermophilus]
MSESSSSAPQAETARPPAALAGVRVLDLSRVLAGPWASQIFADLGAEVVKIERPGRGDDTRGWGPPFLHDADGEATDAAYFLSANRNKRSVAIDIAAPEGAALVRRLAAQADVLIENFKVGGLRKYGLDYESLRNVNRRLVYCSVTGFGQTGPYAARAGYDYMIQAMGGLMSITGQPDGAPGAEPMKVGVAVADLFAGMYAAAGALAALRHAERTGEGQHLDVALYDCQIAMLANQAANYLVSGVAPGRLGNAHPNIAPYQVFETADGHIVIAVGNDGQFAAFARLIGRPELAADARFETNRRRVENRAALIAEIAPAIRERTSKAWFELLEAAGVPAGPINAIDAVFADPQTRARAMAAPAPQEAARAEAPDLRYVPHPVKYSATPARFDGAPPALGAHTRDVLESALGLSAAEIAALAKKGVIAI